MDIRIRIGQVNGCGIKSHLCRRPFSRFLCHLHQPNGIRRRYDIRLKMAFAENHTIHKGLLQAIFRRILLHNIPILQRQHTRQNHTIAKRRQQHQNHRQRKQFPDTSNHCSLLPFILFLKFHPTAPVNRQALYCCQSQPMPTPYIPPSFSGWQCAPWQGHS